MRRWRVGISARLSLLLQNRDAKFCAEFRQTLAARDVKYLRLPPRSPNLDAFAERWVRSAKEGCLSKLILFGEASRDREALITRLANVMKDQRRPTRC